MTKCYSNFDIILRVGIGFLSGILVGAGIMFLIHFLYTEGFNYDKEIKEFRTEVIHIDDAWEVNIYPDAKFDVVPYVTPKEKK